MGGGAGYDKVREVFFLTLSSSATLLGFARMVSAFYSGPRR